MTKDEIKALETYVKTIVPENSICIIQCSADKIEDLSKSLGYLNQDLGVRFGVVFVACPDDVKISMIPARSEVSFQDEQSG